ncbi:hypothetical protein CTQ69_29275, partial [Salmonella enterica subsp. diarizonae]|nr:hypothetical protein [Salmonella enterica subsp. diarizonae]ECC3917921.1 hypothetical protein [Salmonella enterica subsp. diarizonae]
MSVFSGSNRRTPRAVSAARVSVAYSTRGLQAGTSLKQEEGSENEKRSPSTRRRFRNTCPRTGRRQRG